MSDREVLDPDVQFPVRVQPDRAPRSPRPNPAVSVIARLSSHGYGTPLTVMLLALRNLLGIAVPRV